MLEREHFEVDRDAGKSQVTSKHESKSQAQWFVLVDSGRVWTLLGSRKNSRPRMREMLVNHPDSHTSDASRKIWRSSSEDYLRALVMIWFLRTLCWAR